MQWEGHVKGRDDPNGHAQLIRLSDWGFRTRHAQGQDAGDVCQSRDLFCVIRLHDHLTDRQLYTLIYRDILPSPEKKIDNSNNYLHWDCSDAGGDETVWLRFYASDEDRDAYSAETHAALPPKELPPYPRMLPREPS